MVYIFRNAAIPHFLIFTETPLLNEPVLIKGNGNQIVRSSQSYLLKVVVSIGLFNSHFVHFRKMEYILFG